MSVEIHNNSSLSSGSRYCNQKSYHDENTTYIQCFTCVFCPRLIRNVQSRQRLDSSSIIAHPVNFDIQRERSLKCDANNSTYIYTHRYHPLNKQYGFSISVQPEVTSLLRVFFNVKKKCFSKVGRSVIS